MVALIALLLVVGLILLGQPLFVIIGGLAASCYYYISEEPISIVIGDIFYAADKEILLAVPLFVLAGQIMTKGSIASRLIRLAKAVTAPVPSGLVIASVISCAIFAAISGSSPVTLIAVGSILYPALIEAGYDKKFSMGMLSVGGTLGIIVPPSIPMIIFAIMASVSVVDLFKAGIGPSLLLIGLLIIYAIIRGKGKETRQKIDSNELKSSLKAGILSLLMPGVILGGIYSGFFTATESAAVAVLYALIVEFLIHREIPFKQMGTILSETANLLGILFLILILAVSFNKFMTYEDIPQGLVETMSGLINSKIGFILAVNVLLLIVGCIMDIMSAILVLAPILTPMAIHYGIDPIHFGIIMIVNLEIGYITPPIGINLFVASGIFKRPLGEVIASVVPLIGLLLIGLLIISFVPSISLFPNTG
jgi:C4-dicarboxylate transporter DctM subunit